ncbi:MAG: response regulator [Pseudomonadota bacterium]
MPLLRILFIDDDEKSVRPASEWAERVAFSCRVVSFIRFKEDLEDYQPHIAIVDRIEGKPPEGTDQGRLVFDEIWEHRFCPVVIYSAFPEDDEDDRKRHPLVKRVTKGADLGPFTEAIEILRPHAQGIEDAERHIRGQFAIALREVAPYAASIYGEPKEYNEAVIRHGRRRLAALMDELSLGALASWEHYIHPPISKDIIMGDVIRQKEGNPEDPGAFRVVLTPSCDLVASGKRKPKVEEVLVAACCSPKQGIKSTALKDHDPKKLRETLISAMLTQGFYQKIVPFPILKGKIPPMMADLKKLDLIPISEITLDGSGKYIRIASLDSPFRELISWAYMQIACRPGLPDRDFESWRDEIIKAYEDEK